MSDVLGRRHHYLARLLADEPLARIQRRPNDDPPALVVRCKACVVEDDPHPYRMKRKQIVAKSPSVSMCMVEWLAHVATTGHELAVDRFRSQEPYRWGREDQ